MASVVRKLVQLVKPNAEAVDSPLQSELAKACKRLEACRSSLALVQQFAADARTNLDRALEELAAKQADHEAAKASYAAQPTDLGAKRVRASRDDLELITIRCNKPRAVCESADESARAAALAVLEVEQEVARLERQSHIEETKRSATVESFRSRTAEKYARLLALRSEMRELCIEIDDEFTATVAASEELRREGVSCIEASPLGREHEVFPFILAAAEREPAKSVGLMHNTQRFQFSAPHGLRSVMRVSVLDDISDLANSVLPGDPADLEFLRHDLQKRERHQGYIDCDRWRAAQKMSAAFGVPALEILERAGSKLDALAHLFDCQQVKSKADFEKFFASEGTK